jgi:hypothetical protein
MQKRETISDARNMNGELVLMSANDEQLYQTDTMEG